MKKIFWVVVMLFSVVGATAQRPYHYQKTSLFEVLPIHSKDIVFLGNSITDGCEWAELLDNPRVKNRGISADRSTWMLDRLDPIVKGKPAKLFLMIGINDLGYSVGDTKSIITNVRKLIERFHRESPRTKLYVQSLLPVNPKFEQYATRHGARQAEIIMTNQALQALAVEMGVIYVDVYSKLVDSEGCLDKRYTNDGLHLLGEGYLVWREVLNPYLKK